MTAETAEQIVDLALQSTSPSLDVRAPGARRRAAAQLRRAPPPRRVRAVAQPADGRQDADLQAAQQPHRHDRGGRRVADRQRRAGEHQPRRTGDRARLEPPVEGRQRARGRGALDRLLQPPLRRARARSAHLARRRADDHDAAHASRRGGTSSTSTWRAACAPSTCGRSSRAPRRSRHLGDDRLHGRGVPRLLSARARLHPGAEPARRRDRRAHGVDLPDQDPDRRRSRASSTSSRRAAPAPARSPTTSTDASSPATRRALVDAMGDPIFELGHVRAS